MLTPDWCPVRLLGASFLLGTGSAPAESPSGSHKPELAFLTWSDYIGAGVVAGFEQRCGCTVTEVYFETDTRAIGSGYRRGSVS